ncbi:MAG: hypothetical protein ACHQHO_10970 [Solirubrobacterales bacterium]
MSATTTRRIVCVETEHPHRHILAVGIGTEGSHATERMTVSAVRSAIANGDVFYTVGSVTGEVALVSPDDCRIGGCTIKTIRTHPDDTRDDNLDEMRVCSWKA